MADSKQLMRQEMVVLMLIPAAVILLGYVAVWSKSVTLRIMSQIMYYSGNASLAQPLAERAVEMNADKNADMTETLWCVWNLSEIYRAQHKYSQALPGYQIIDEYNKKRGQRLSFMPYQTESRISESLHAMGRNNEAAAIDASLHIKK
jgi:hypothetical protein